MMEVKSQEELVELAKQVLDVAAELVAENLPQIKSIGMEIIDTVFVPKAVGKQLALVIALETGAITMSQLVAVFRAVMSNFSTRSRLIRQLHQNQNKAETQDEWMDLAEQIDSIQGNDVWRTDPDCPLYERDRISSRIDEFVHLMRRRDIFDLMFTLRAGVARNKFGLLHEGLFSRAKAGTKVLVETYHNVVCAALDFVCDAPTMRHEDPIPTEARLAFFNETRHAYGRTALLLSGGAALGFYHIGVVKALMENGLMPRVLGGSSAGSVVAAIVATRTDEECFRDFFNVEGTKAPGHSGMLAHSFFRPLQVRQKISASSSLDTSGSEVVEAKRIWQVLFPIGLRNFTSSVYDVLTGYRRPQDLLKSDTEYLANNCRNNIGNFTFQEAFDRTGRILNITVTPSNRSDPPRLLNYLTAPHVLVWSAAVASAALPGVFEPGKLLVRDADGTERCEGSTCARFADGSMENDLPMEQLSEMFNINHFVISQANPHAVMFASFGLDKSVWSNPMVRLLTGIAVFVKSQLKSWFRHFVELVGGGRIAPLWDTRRGFWSQFFTQEYEGRDLDISLIPWQSHRSLLSAFMHCIHNPSRQEFLDWIQAAERETWKYIPAIKSHIAEEMTLDRCVQRLRKRLLTESLEREMTSSNMLSTPTTASAARTHEKTAQGSDVVNTRVPSFFTSRSLINMGGLAIGDPTSITVSIGGPQSTIDSTNGGESSQNGVLELKPGWGGMGLKGNHSTGSLCSSGASGLFIMDEVDSQSDLQTGKGPEKQLPVQHPGEMSSLTPIKAGLGYLKTTSMASFYYRKSKSHNNLLSDGDSVATVPTSHRPKLNRRVSKSANQLMRS
mmetsp:Transcript_19132/g.29073  ORF Transcript_19132/g.29073 Transcript_19132/m.29073 type:complete len:842 (-) Transcript_19132:65-2590(-)|eukprot:CAMPEP_0118684494 /NCGR_PEP_ID=MMETSP0800-20121206/6676_1 /TAXON_ID=210618 ORGANISM="Striatella unipunctata, Strain CCMP2910" /NCGR_SAMPLE_ID=MMETSP0800 /ASSEMBLY_ACC=CAM_ASM_000638 /LENGTH=841 /DNA_ID=CAMNT_0006581209 /DNA_START=122 /DNA_END=2650 /DNA_ORIENTATION=-